MDIHTLNTYVPPKPQSDVVLSRDNPVSEVWYTVLTAINIRIQNIASAITWGVTQPTPLEVIVETDDVTITYIKADPVSQIWYEARLAGQNAEDNQVLDTLGAYANFRSFLLEARNVIIKARITWAITQPTPLTCRVKYSMWD